MSEEFKRSGGRFLVAPSMTTSNDRLSSSGSIPVGASGKKIVIKSADMKEDMQKEAVDVAIAAFEKHDVEKDVAENIKKVFDKKHGPTWHCIVGKNFDLLTTYRATVDCYQKLVQFHTTESGSWFFYGEGARPPMPIVTALKACRALESGGEGYLIYAIDTSTGSVGIDDLPVVCA